MKTFSIILTLAVVLFGFAGRAFACGDEQGSVEAVRASADMARLQARLETLVQVPLQLDDVIYSGNDVLDFDKKPAISAMCAAHFYNLYFVSAENPGLICKFTVEPTAGGALSDRGSIGACRLADGSVVREKIK